LTTELEKRWEETGDFEQCPHLQDCTEKVIEINFEVFCLEGCWKMCEKVPEEFSTMKTPKEWLKKYVEKEVENIE